MDPPREHDPTNALISPGTTTGVQSPVADRPGQTAQAVDHDGAEDRSDEEMTEHLGYAKHDTGGRRTGNIRNSASSSAP